MKITAKVSLILLLIVNLLTGVDAWLSISTTKDAKVFFDGIGAKAEKFVKEIYPADLEIKVVKGEVSLNQKLPYCLKFDDSDTGVIFDDSENPNIKAFEEQPKNYPCKPGAIIGKTYIVTTEDGGKIDIQKIPVEANFNIDQKILTDIVLKYSPIVGNWGWKLYLMLPIFIVLLITPFVLLFNFWYGLILKLAIKMFKLTDHPEAKNNYWIALFFASAFSALQTVLLKAFDFQINFPFAGTILITAAGIVYLRHLNPSVPRKTQDISP